MCKSVGVLLVFHLISLVFGDKTTIHYMHHKTTRHHHHEVSLGRLEMVSLFVEKIYTEIRCFLHGDDF
jgi:hypothetical protein